MGEDLGGVRDRLNMDPRSEREGIDLDCRMHRDLGRLEGLRCAAGIVRCRRMDFSGHPPVAWHPEIQEREKAVEAALSLVEDDIQKRSRRDAASMGYRRIHLFDDKHPPVVCLVGSTRFAEEMNRITDELTRLGQIVLRPEVIKYDAARDPQKHNPALKAKIDAVFLYKIDMSDEVLCVNVGGYIGESTRREIEYAISIDRPVLYTEPMK